MIYGRSCRVYRRTNGSDRSQLRSDECARGVRSSDAYLG